MEFQSLFLLESLVLLSLIAAFAQSADEAAIKNETFAFKVSSLEAACAYWQTQLYSLTLKKMNVMKTLFRIKIRFLLFVGLLTQSAVIAQESTINITKYLLMNRNKIVTYLPLLLFLLATNYKSLSAQNVYCQYCFYLVADGQTGKLTISNVFTSPARLDQGNQYGYYCTSDLDETHRYRASKLGQYNSGWAIYNTTIDGNCNAYEEKQIEQRQLEERERLKREEDRKYEEAKRLEQQRYEEEKERKRKEEERAANTIRQTKDNFLKYYQTLEKPVKISNGWHRVAIMADDIVSSTPFMVLVEENKVRKLAQPFLVLYDSIVDVTTAPIKEGKTIAKVGEKYLEIFFIQYMENPTYKGTPPIQDKRAYWWQKELAVSWKELLNESARIGGNPFYVPVDFTKSSLDMLAKVDAIEIRASSSTFEEFFTNVAYDLKHLQNPYFTNLSNLKIIITGDNYKVYFKNRNELLEYEKKIKAWQEINASERNLLAGQLAGEYGLFSDTKKAKITLAQMKSASLDTLAKSSELKYPANMYPSSSVTKASLLPNLKRLYLSNSPTDDNAIRALAANPNLHAIYACETPLVKNWKKMNKKERRAFLNHIQSKFPKLQTLTLCSKNEPFASRKSLLSSIGLK